MELVFPVTKIRPKSDLIDKMIQFNIEPFLHRIFVEVEFLDANQEVRFITEAIIDTGAPFSLFSKEILPLIDEDITIPHTVHGIVDKIECNISTDLSVVPIKIKDKLGNKSPILPILSAFFNEPTLPNLLGLKGVIDQPNVRFVLKEDTFTIKFGK